jgi:RimJ/RimL family protein N-acetyltransferase
MDVDRVIEIDELTPKQWSYHSEQAHAVVFGERKPATLDRIDFALVVREGRTLMGYLTCRELDSESVYWQYGGAFPGTRGSSMTFLGYTAYVQHCKLRYKRIGTLIENDNLAMIKMAMKVGFKIVGIRNFNGQILLEHLLEFSDAK